MSRSCETFEQARDAMLADMAHARRLLKSLAAELAGPHHAIEVLLLTAVLLAKQHGKSEDQLKETLSALFAIMQPHEDVGGADVRVVAEGDMTVTGHEGAKGAA